MKAKMYAWLIEPHLVLSWCDTMNLLAKKLKKYMKKLKKLVPPYFNLPVHTCNTMVWVHGVVVCQNPLLYMYLCYLFWTHHGFTHGQP
jgi:hypothetical protein